MSGCPFTLSARERRGELDAAERRRLEMALSASLEFQLLHEAGRGFDAEDAWLPGDDAAAERVTQAVLARTRGSRPRRRGWVMALVGALVLVVISAGTARAMYGTWRFWSGATPATPGVTDIHKGKAHKPSRVGSSKVQTPATVETLQRLEEPVAPESPVARAVAESPSPSQLFADATRARQKGQLDRAIVLYDTLQGRFPGSAEAQASDIALGMLHLGRGNPGPAAAHFRRYLRQSPNAALASEALFGQARSYEALGRAAEARQSFAELLRRYPDSAYADVARSKINSSP